MSIKQVALRALGFPVKKAEVLELLRRQAVDEERIDKLDFETFRLAVGEKLGERTLQVGGGMQAGDDDELQGKLIYFSGAAGIRSSP